MDVLAQIIKRRRQALNVSQTELAKLAGVTRQCVYLWENERTSPNAKQLLALCAALKMAPNDLLRNNSEART